MTNHIGSRDIRAHPIRPPPHPSIHRIHTRGRICTGIRHPPPARLGRYFPSLRIRPGAEIIDDRHSGLRARSYGDGDERCGHGDRVGEEGKWGYEEGYEVSRVWSYGDPRMEEGTAGAEDVV
jgi:hypothetical protein